MTFYPSPPAGPSPPGSFAGIKSNLFTFLGSTIFRRGRLLFFILILAILTTLSTLFVYRVNISEHTQNLLNPQSILDFQFAQGPSTPLDPAPPHHAYIFYATNYDYSCSTLVNVDRLLNHPTIKTKAARIGIYISRDMDNGTDAEQEFSKFFDMLAHITRGRVFIVRAEPPQNKLKDPMPHYKDVLLKLVSFDLGVRDVSNTTATAPQWTAWGETGEQKVDRMIIMDSDQLIMRNLDHLFDLPPVEIAAPRTYWSSNKNVPFGSTTTLMVARPSKSLWKKMQDAMGTLRGGEYDMDLVQRVFGNEIMTLPGRYCTLNSHWEVNDQPFWYHHEADERVHLDEQLEWEKVVGEKATTEDGFPMMGTNYTKEDQAQKGARRKWKEDKGVGLLWDTEVVHFTALGKPWSFTVGDVRFMRPEAHWLFAEMFGEWRRAARTLCPEWANIYGTSEELRPHIASGHF
ncbi:hypothetical protein EV426DRAFT_605317 [Tirmania nivea]|nr:hypothetical protein EV426DRAFT_605317 [Tirmania nivea]